MKVLTVISFVALGLAVLLYAVSLMGDAALSAEVFPAILAFAVLCAIGWILPAARGCDGRLDLFHPAILFLLFFLVYFAFSAWTLVFLGNYDGLIIDLGPNPAVIVNTVMILGVLSVVGFGIGLRLYPISFAWQLIRHREFRRNSTFLALVILVVILGLLAQLYHLSLYGDFGFDIVRYLSPGRRRDADIQVSQLVLMLESLAQWGLLIYLFRLFANVHRLKHSRGSEYLAWAFLLAVLLGAFLVSGKRSVIIAGLAIPLLWRHYLVARIGVATMVVYFALGMFGIIGLLFARIALPLLAEGLSPFDYLGGSFWDVLDFYLNTPEFSTFEMIVGGLIYRDDLLARIGDPTVLALFRFTFGTMAFFVPRAVWPDKPVFQDVGHVFFQHFTGNDAEVGFAVTVWGTALLFFHVPGIIFGFILLGWIVNSLYTMLIRAVSGDRFDGIFLYGLVWWLLFQLLRFGTLGFTFLYFFQTLAVGAVVYFMVTRGERVALTSLPRP